MRALVIGGTGPTGHFIVNGLLERGYEVAILHRGSHEIPEIPPEVEHIHTRSVSRRCTRRGRRGSYLRRVRGDLRTTACHRADAGRQDRPVRLHRRRARLPWLHERRPVFARRASRRQFAKMRHSSKTQRMTTKAGVSLAPKRRCSKPIPERFTSATPTSTGVTNSCLGNGAIVRRILDRRPHIIVPDDGLSLQTYGYAGNLAHAVLLGVDHPEVAAGQI